MGQSKIKGQGGSDVEVTFRLIGAGKSVRPAGLPIEAHAQVGEFVAVFNQMSELIWI
jgi:hypothetical protein